MRKFALMLAALVLVLAPSLAEAKGKKASPAAKQTVQEDPNGRFAHAISDLLASLSRPPAPPVAAKPAKSKKKG